MHNIKPHTMHSIVTVRVAIRSTDEGEVADAINEALRPFCWTTTACSPTTASRWGTR